MDSVAPKLVTDVGEMVAPKPTVVTVACASLPVTPAKNEIVPMDADVSATVALTRPLDVEVVGALPVMAAAFHTRDRVDVPSRV
jgi:hypothetical protein